MPAEWVRKEEGGEREKGPRGAEHDSLPPSSGLARPGEGGTSAPAEPGLGSSLPRGSLLRSQARSWEAMGLHGEPGCPLA